MLLWSTAWASLPGWLQDPARALPWLLLAMATLVVLLVLGRAIGQRLQLKLVGIPEALVAGTKTSASFRNAAAAGEFSYRRWRAERAAAGNGERSPGGSAGGEAVYALCSVRGTGGIDR